MSEITETQDLFFKCDCSKEKLSEALITVGKDELQAMINEDHGCQLLVSSVILSIILVKKN